MHVAEILKQKGTEVVTVPPDAPIAEVAAILAERRFGALVVSAGDASIDGIISERDVVRGLAASGGDLLDQPVSSLMTAEVRTCAGSETVEQLMERMTEHRIRHLPVEDGGRLAGMISIGDVVKFRVTELEEEARHLQGYIAGEGYA